MLFECNECQVVVKGQKAPFVCPQCGLAGVRFAPISEKAMAARVAEGDGEPINLEAFIPQAQAPQLRAR